MKLSPSESAEDLKPNRYKWLSLLVMALALAIVVIDGTVLNVSQKYIINDLGSNLQSIQWAITSYSLVIASLTILGGRLGDMFGRKKAFILGAIIFAIGSLMTALAKDSTMLIIGWSIIEGIGAALMIPASSALIVSNFEGKERGIAFGIYGATAGAASSFGPILGGWLSTSFSWRWAFGINVVIAALLCVGSVVVRDYHTKNKQKQYLDLVGVALSSTALLSIMYGIIESNTYGWWGAKKGWEMFGQTINFAGISVTPIAILIGIMLAVLFVIWELRVEKQGKEPLIRVEIFNNRQFSFGIATLAAQFGGFSGLITYGIIFFLLTVKGLSAFDSGLALIPFSLATFIMAPISSRISDKIGQRNLIQLGLAINLVGTILIYSALRYEATVQDFIPAFLVSGVGFGLIAAQLNNLILSSVKVTESGVASGINGTMREIGRAFGVALIGAAFIGMVSSSAQSNIQSNNSIPDQAKPALIKQFESSDSFGREVVSKTDDEVRKEGASRGIPVQGQQAYITQYRKTENAISESVKRAITESSKNALLYTIGFSTVALVLAFGLPTGKKLGGDVISQAAVIE
jgi:EmrB/QacA subfamily drug resistance transporter